MDATNGGHFVKKLVGIKGSNHQINTCPVIFWPNGQEGVRNFGSFEVLRLMYRQSC